MPRKPAAVDAADLIDVSLPRDGGTVRMRRMVSTREYLAFRKGQDEQIAELTLAAIVDCPVDPLDLPFVDLFKLAEAWVERSMDDAVPPPTATP